MIHLEVCSLLFGQKTKLHTALRRRLGVGVWGSLQDLHSLDPMRKKLEDINLSNNATNYSTTAQLPTKKMQIFCYSKFVSPLSDQIIQNFTAFYYFNLCSSAIEVYLSRYNSKWDRERRVNSTLSDHFGLENFNFGNYSFLDEIQLLWTKTNAVSTMAFEMES